MYEKPITYEDYDGVTQTETLWFNLSGTEVLKLMAEYGGPEKMQKTLNDAVESEDFDVMIKEFDKIVSRAYGLRDGKKFLKSPEIVADWQSTASYDAFFLDLTTKEGEIGKFLAGVIPERVLKQLSQQDQPLPPASQVQGPPSS